MADKKKTTTETKPTKRVKAKKKRKLASVNGIAHIHATVNNTIVTFSDLDGNVLTWASSGTSGYKGSKKSTPYAAGVAATTATKNAMAMGLKSVVIHVNGTGQGKDTAMRSIAACGIEVTELNDVTAIPHNGCRPPKKPR
ncbi:MAG: 30S ribosomal protein S11 [Mycoplasmataceae bacterium]|nr:30S ribosomal protein S11 [Mycoplasmataceae bacterium]